MLKAYWANACSSVLNDFSRLTWVSKGRMVGLGTASGLAIVGYITLAISTERPLRLVIPIIVLLVLAGIGLFMLKLATYPVKLALSQQAENERLRTRINLMNSVETCLIRLEDLRGEAKDIAAEDIANEQEFDHWNVRSNRVVEKTYSELASGISAQAAMAYIRHPGVMSTSDEFQEQYKARVATRYTARLTALIERHHFGLRLQAPQGVCHETPFDALGWGDAELRFA